MYAMMPLIVRGVILMNSNKSKGTVLWDPKLHGGIVIYSNSSNGFMKACTYSEKGGADSAPAFIRAAVEAKANWAIVHTKLDSIYDFVLRAARAHPHLIPGKGNVYVLPDEMLTGDFLMGNSDVIVKIWPNKLEPQVHFGTRGWTPSKKSGMKFAPKFNLLGD
tara:strand:- start:276 stop:764 length:489 start_codon:yes stop_codon:yes gene_type:complete